MDSAHKMEHITGVILAGGKSRRMGRDKAGLKIGGVTFFDNLLGIMRRLFARVIIAGDRPDLERPDVPSYPDRHPGSALGGVYTGLLMARNEMIFVSSCDIPFPDEDLVRYMISVSRGFDIVVPQTANGLEPLFACYNKNCLTAMQRMLDRGEYRIYDFYPDVRVNYIDMEEHRWDWKRALLNVNTPEEFDRIKGNERAHILHHHIQAVRQ